MPHAPAPPKIRRHAKIMRRAMRDAELKLWNAVRAHRLMGLAFRRQMLIASHIVDFACPSKKLIVELDGSHHGEDAQIAHDEIRAKRLADDGWTILRFWNHDVLNDIDGVCQHIVVAAGLGAPKIPFDAMLAAASHSGELRP